MPKACNNERDVVTGEESRYMKHSLLISDEPADACKLIASVSEQPVKITQRSFLLRGFIKDGGAY
jgi:hypothetical protein